MLAERLWILAFGVPCAVALVALLTLAFSFPPRWALVAMAIAMVPISLGLAGIACTRWVHDYDERAFQLRRIRSGEIYPTHPEHGKDRR